LRAARGRATASHADAALEADIASKYPDGLGADALAAYDVAVTTLTNLYMEARELNDNLSRLGRRFKAAGTSRTAAWEGGAPAQRSFASHDSDGALLAIIVDGTSFQVSNPSNWVRTAVCEVAHSQGGMPLPYSENLFQRTKGQTPALLEDRRRAGRHG